MRATRLYSKGLPAIASTLPAIARVRGAAVLQLSHPSECSERRSLSTVTASPGDVDAALKWREHFRKIMSDTVCASSVDALDSTIPAHFDPDYIQHVDGKTIGFSEFVQHMKAVVSKVKDVNLRYKELHAYPVEENGRRTVHIVSHHFVTFATRSDDSVGEAEVVGLFKADDETGKIYQCNELTRVAHASKEVQDLGSTM